MAVIQPSLDSLAFKTASWGGVTFCVPLLRGSVSFIKTPTIRWRRGLVAAPRTRGADGGGHRSVCHGANLALLFGSGRGWHHGSFVAAIVMGHNGGRSRPQMSRKMNQVMFVASDPTPRGRIYGSQTISAPPRVCVPQAPLAVALGTIVGWMHQGTRMPLLLPTTPLVVHILRPTMVVGLRSNCSGSPLRHIIRVTLIAVQEQGTSLTRECTLAPPTPLVQTDTSLHHGPPNLGKFTKSHNQISLGIHQRDLKFGLLKYQPQYDLLTNTRNWKHTTCAIRGTSAAKTNETHKRGSKKTVAMIDFCNVSFQ